jgi:hypothetical protein
MVKAIQPAYFTLRRRASTLAAFVVLAAAFTVAGCAVKLIGDYDDTIDKGVTDVQQKAELYFAKLQSTPNTPFDQTFYDGIASSLAVLKSRAASLPKYNIIVEQIANLKSQFDTLQKLDKGAARPISAAIVTDSQKAIEVSVESILKLELALKSRGTSLSPPPSPKAN